MLFDVTGCFMIRVSAVIGLLTASVVHAQQYVISTVAGAGPLLRTPALALDVPISPWGVATDAQGSVYFASSGFIFRLDPAGLLTRIAGNHPDHRAPYSGDGGLATEAVLSPLGVAVSNTGDIFIADVGSSRVRRVSPSGIITTVAGNGTRGFSGDGGPATDAQLAAPSGVALDSAGNLFVLDGNNKRVRKVSPSGIITTVAGNGSRGYSGDGGPATNAHYGSRKELQSTPRAISLSPITVTTASARFPQTGSSPLWQAMDRPVFRATVGPQPARS
jgi:hypothetical protein